MIANAVSITLNVAGLPPLPLPGAYVAAVICKLCASCNRIVAAMNAPESFDAMTASGITAEPIVIITKREQMIALVVYFSSADFGALVDESFEF